MRRAAAVLVSAGVLAAAGCSPGSLRLTWEESFLPTSVGTPLVRDATVCDDGSWVVVGGVESFDGSTRPAAWSSADAVTWRTIPLKPTSFYGEQSVLSAAACAHGRLVLLGSKSGGVHGNPRTSSWVGAPAGPVREVDAPFELFGGPEAVNAGRLRTGPDGFLIVGNRVSGAAVWTSRDGARFALREGAGPPGSWASDAVADGGGWRVVGARTVSGGVREPGVWFDGRAEPVDAGEPLWAGPSLLLGVHAGRFRAWRQVDGRWVGGAAFDKVEADAPPPWVTGAVAGGRSFAVTGGGGRYGLWASSDSGRSWSAADLPLELPRSATTAVVLAGSGERLLLARDSGFGVRLFVSGQ